MGPAAAQIHAQLRPDLLIHRVGLLQQLTGSVEAGVGAGGELPTRSVGVIKILLFPRCIERIAVVGASTARDNESSTGASSSLLS